MKQRIGGCTIAVVALLLMRQVQVAYLVEHRGIAWWALEAGRWIAHAGVVWLLASTAMCLERRLTSAERRLNEIGVILEVERLELDIEDEEGVLSRQ